MDCSGTTNSVKEGKKRTRGKSPFQDVGAKHRGEGGAAGMLIGRYPG